MSAETLPFRVEVDIVRPAREKRAVPSLGRERAPENPAALSSSSSSVSVSSWTMPGSLGTMGELLPPTSSASWSLSFS